MLLEAFKHLLKLVMSGSMLIIFPTAAEAGNKCNYAVIGLPTAAEAGS